MKYTTSITNIVNEHEFIRGYALEELTKNHSFVETIFLLLKGQLPNEKETRMLNAIFTAAVDHGPGTASAQTARITASAKNSLHTSLAAGILAMGERHGGAIEGAAKFFQHHVGEEHVAGLLKTFQQEKIRIPGYGHAVLSVDHRSKTLFDVAREVDLFGEYASFALRVEEELNKIASKPLPLNVDGAMAAILLDMGFAPELMKGFFIIARVPGLVAHIYEEMTNDEGLRRLVQDEIEYVGR